MPDWTYLGDGQGYLSGVPARDLTADEYAGLEPSKQHDVEASGLYARLDDIPEVMRAPEVVTDAG